MERLRVGAGPAADRRRILLFSYHFPPGTSAGALRWQKMSRIGSELGWDCDVLTHPLEEAD
jgi:hypothetical protein